MSNVEEGKRPAGKPIRTRDRIGRDELEDRYRATCEFVRTAVELHDLGQVFTEAELRAHSGSNDVHQRSDVREALRALEHLGIVERFQWGWHVRIPSIRETRLLMECRSRFLFCVVREMAQRMIVSAPEASQSGVDELEHLQHLLITELRELQQLHRNPGGMRPQITTAKWIQTHHRWMQCCAALAGAPGLVARLEDINLQLRFSRVVYPANLALVITNDPERQRRLKIEGEAEPLRAAHLKKDPVGCLEVFDALVDGIKKARFINAPGGPAHLVGSHASFLTDRVRCIEQAFSKATRTDDIAQTDLVVQLCWPFVRRVIAETPALSDLVGKPPALSSPEVLERCHYVFRRACRMVRERAKEADTGHLEATAGYSIPDTVLLVSVSVFVRRSHRSEGLDYFLAHIRDAVPAPMSHKEEHVFKLLYGDASGGANEETGETSASTARIRVHRLRKRLSALPCLLGAVQEEASDNRWFR